MIDEEKKKEFFKKLTELTKKFNASGVKEVKAIALVYQVAFKYVESVANISYPTLYSYTPIEINKKVVEKYKDEVHEVAKSLLQVVCQEEAFADLMTMFAEESGAVNKNLAQYFSPQDIADFVGNVSVATAKVEQFEQTKYVCLGDPSGCGAGSLVLAQLRALSKIDGFKDKHYESCDVYMNDIDEDLSRIAFFQVLLSCIIHKKPLGRLEAEGKNILSEYLTKKNCLLFIANVHRDKLVFPDFY